MTAKTWHSGLNNYRKHTMEFGPERNIFTTEISDTEISNFDSVQSAMAEHFYGKNVPAEILYSGGLDSECSLISCLQNKIPVVAMTLRLIYKQSPFNTHDLYYAEKFCRENQIKHVLIDLDVESFFGNGDHIKYMEPYKLTMPHVAAHMWLLGQCVSCPVIGGDYTWPQLNIGRKVYSPLRHEYCFYDIFMQENGISGIGNMLSHSLESNIFFIKEHIKVHEEDPDNIDGDNLKIRYLKKRMLENMGFGNLELRHKSFGWETTITGREDWFDFRKVRKELRSRFHDTDSIIKWNQTLGDLIGGEPGVNNCYGSE